MTVTFRASLPAVLVTAFSAATAAAQAGRPATVDDFLRLGERPRVIAHRGFSGVAPENTLAAFRRAIEIGADMIETDVGLTRDGHVVCLHDETLDRTTNGTGLLSAATFDEVRRLDAGSWFAPELAGEKVPTLAEVLDLARGRILVNVEIKSEAVGDRVEGGIADKVLSLVGERGMLEEVIISSFEPEALNQVRQLEPGAKTASLYNKKLHKGMSPSEVMDAVGAVAFNVPARKASRKVVRDSHRSGRPVAVYTINKEARMRRCLKIGVNALFTDYPDRMLRVLGEK